MNSAYSIWKICTNKGGGLFCSLQTLASQPCFTNMLREHLCSIRGGGKWPTPNPEFEICWLQLGHQQSCQLLHKTPASKILQTPILSPETILTPISKNVISAINLQLTQKTGTDSNYSQKIPTNSNWSLNGKL